MQPDRIERLRALISEAQTVCCPAAPFRFHQKTPYRLDNFHVFTNRRDGQVCIRKEANKGEGSVFRHAA